MTKMLQPAPDWDIMQWLNADRPLDLASLRGRVVVAAAFQMLCPGCVMQTIPRMRQVHSLFATNDVAVVGLHTVFEHHEAMMPTALAAFLYEYKVTFPVGVDRPGERGDPIPSTMRRYAMQGTPTLILIDRFGRLRRQVFGHIPDLQLGAEIMALIREARSDIPTHEEGAASAGTEAASDCDDRGCPV
ncbi:redoxin domain-containing protein [Pseudaminobacter sp. NGMCC 1.201702]|uniref:redoxin domain-containing protein n=1 Tax=Pseudaminobacter sp. NGMCC 1.201702 TaxID=3391825 RepID=UPI0039F0202A